MRHLAAFALLLAAGCSDPAADAPDASVLDAGQVDAASLLDRPSAPYETTAGFQIVLTPAANGALTASGSGGEFASQLRTVARFASLRFGHAPSSITIRRATIELGGASTGVERLDDFLESMAVTIVPQPIGGVAPDPSASVTIGRASRPAPARWGGSPVVLSDASGALDPTAPVQRYLLAASVEVSAAAVARATAPSDFRALVTVTINLTANP